ncbi:type II toxin-antitoxin system VapC family toxin [uncultured Hydrogenophaga sp.]|uniref:type II toxin-antitoxin system VapC family toxin n=1 Tax=uncultured Hydrogenophaga sp. TaxID=199683 RepID=UPI00258EC8D6|nr:type II toxin-antitoxin system VapC family toxin [uncultured Hydrogenophaga sp.]
MKPWVIDASVAVAWLIPEHQHPRCDEHYGRARGQAGLYHAPALWHWQVGQALLLACRSGRLPRAHYERGLELVAQAQVEIDPPPNLHRRSQVLRLAEAHQISYLDAAYLELVVRLNGTLLSREAPLLAAARACGIAVEPF